MVCTAEPNIFYVSVSALGPDPSSSFSKKKYKLEYTHIELCLMYSIYTISQKYPTYVA